MCEDRAKRELKILAEIGAMRPRMKECHKLKGARKCFSEPPEGVWASRRSVALLTLGFSPVMLIWGFWPSEVRENTFLQFSTASLWQFVIAATQN